MSAVELVLRSVGATELVLLAALMLQARRRDSTAWLGAALCASVGAFLLTSMPDADHRLGPLSYPLTALCSTHPVWFWLFCAALFGDRFRLARSHWLCAAGMAVTGLVFQSSLQLDGREGARVLSQVLAPTFGAASLLFACLGPLAVWAGRRIDLDERRRRIRSWFVPAVAAYLGIVAATQVISVLSGREAPDFLVVANLAFIALLATLALLTFVQVRIVNWLDLLEPTRRPDLLNRIEQHVLAQLTRRMRLERLYAREGLTVASLAKLLGTQEHVLRRVINRGLGFRNFSDFLHSHRLPETARRLRDPAARHLPVLTIALEAGYGSLGPFNRAFKARFGMTPVQYRRTDAPADIAHGRIAPSA